MQLISATLADRIERECITALASTAPLQPETTDALRSILDAMYDAIPDRKRISYGRTHVIKVLASDLFARLRSGVDLDRLCTIAVELFERADDTRVKGVALGCLAGYATTPNDTVDIERVLPIFTTAAAHDHWEVREFAQLFFRRLIKHDPTRMHEHLEQLVTDEDPKVRRFVSETLRPVVENKWFYDQPEFSLSIMRVLFSESSRYPRTSVGNNLSDLARRRPELVYDLVDELVAMDDPNAYWIAYRACRNLVKTEPIRVLDALGVDEYRYKRRRYSRDGGN